VMLSREHRSCQPALSCDQARYHAKRLPKGSASDHQAVRGGWQFYCWSIESRRAGAAASTCVMKGPITSTEPSTAASVSPSPRRAPVRASHGRYELVAAGRRRSSSQQVRVRDVLAGSPKTWVLDRALKAVMLRCHALFSSSRSWTETV
jgi:hypothetical protein